jgi:hypothetical protein
MDPGNFVVTEIDLCAWHLFDPCLFRQNMTFERVRGVFDDVKIISGYMLQMPERGLLPKTMRFRCVPAQQGTFNVIAPLGNNFLYGFCGFIYGYVRRVKTFTILYPFILRLVPDFLVGEIQNFPFSEPFFEAQPASWRSPVPSDEGLYRTGFRLYRLCSMPLHIFR